ncbi:MAG: response regulator [Gammaproteobacteria bacterium]|nr:response regulator [Gammaproteobacteria bacterium]
MREEYTGREVAVGAARPLLDHLRDHPDRQNPELSDALGRIDPGAKRMSWDTFCDLLDVTAAHTPDLRGIGSDGLASALYKFRRRVKLARRILTLEDALRFILYPRNPIDFACLNVAVTAEPGRINVVAYLLHGYRECPPFFEVMLGAAQELIRALEVPDGEVTMSLSGRQAHLVFTYAASDGILHRVHRFVSRQAHAIYSILVIRSSYPDLVHGRKLFEEQLVERAKVEEQLTASEQAFERRMLEIDDVIAEYDHTGELVYVSPNLERLIGISVEEVRTDPSRVVHMEDIGRVERGIALALRERKANRVDDFRILDASANTRWVELSLTPATAADGGEHAIAVLRDITERRRHYEERQRLDRQLERTQRLEVLGVLAGGIAHDFNNLLMPILGQAELATMALEDRPELRARVETIRAAADKAADLVRQLMVYAGTETSSFGVVDLGRETGELLELAKTTISPNVELRVSIADKALVQGDVSQLRQVIMNLIINATEAIGDNPGAVDLTVARDDDSVTLSVQDDGCGMDELTRERAFEPFFSTKFAGRGLGLSAVMGIVRAHNGELLLTTELDRGTLVELTLAAADQDGVAPRDDVEVYARGSGAVLLVDDEDAVLQVGKAMLEAVGYEVTTARDGEEALACIDDADFVALVVDLVMPKIDGREVLSAVRRRYPNLPFVMVSGYGAQLVNAETGHDPFTRFLAKPFRVHELSATLSQLTQEVETA